MSQPPADDLNRVLRDLQTYLHQRQEMGLEWFLDTGPESDAPVVEVVAPEPAAALFSAPSPVQNATPAPPSPPSAQESKPAHPPPAHAPRPTSTPAQEGFAKMCEQFVQETLARIEQTRQSVEVQKDMFVGEDEPAPQNREQKAAALAELAAEVAPCEGCKLHSGRTQTVFGVGNADAEIVFIGEAPGRDEDLQGEPFVGRAGKLLNEIFKAIGLAREDVYICNILKCRPPNNRDPEADEVDACEPYLKRQLDILEPKVICCLGRVAAHNLLATRATLGSLRESVHFYQNIPVLATFHPAALLRNPHWKRPTWDDVRKLRALADAL
ncbi:MAG: uracil-DNA glycosylase [bacterium]